jgi:ATP-dependent helicase/nuclease subunit B
VRDLLARRSLTERPYSASSLQQFAACPLRFFLHAIMRLTPRDPVVAFESMDPSLVGNVFHRVVSRVARQLLAEHLIPLQETALERAEAIVASAIDREERDLIERLDPLIHRVFHDEMRLIRDDVVGWLRREIDAELTFVPWATDLSFGGRNPDDDPRSHPAPVKLQKYLLRGAIDAIERHRHTGNLQITDFKTSMASAKAPLYFGAGELLQPLLYTAVVQTLGLGDAPVERARLYHATSKGQYKEVFARMDDHARDHAASVLGIIDRAITGGNLFARPRKGACDVCAYRAICGRDEEPRVRRKNAHPKEVKAMLDDLAWLRQQP